MPAPPLHIACLCAAWCRLCDGYRAVIEAVAAGHRDPARPLVWHWVDIEDEAEALGDVDIETFPTLVVFDADRILFAGVIEPQPETLQRLVRAWLAQAESGQAAAPVDAAIAGFVERWRRRAPDASNRPHAHKRSSE